jgi:hypothetical protein
MVASLSQPPPGTGRLSGAAVAAHICAGLAASIVTVNSLVVLVALMTFEPPNIPDYAAWIFALPILAFTALSLGLGAALAWALLTLGVRQGGVLVGPTIAAHVMIAVGHLGAAGYALRSGGTWDTALVVAAVVPVSLAAAVLSAFSGRPGRRW